MKRIALTLFASAALIPSISAVQTYNNTITAIFGTSNPDDGWTADSAGDLTVALRAKNRSSGDTTNVKGVYSYATGAPTLALWNYEFSVASSSAVLSAYDIQIGVDLDPSAAVNYVFIDVLNDFPDNAYGDSSTPQGGGTVGLGIDLAPYNFLAQNSENIGFLFPILDGSIDGTYDFTFAAKFKAATFIPSPTVSAHIQVIVGKGGASVKGVPDVNMTAGLLGVGLLSLAGFAARTKK